MRKALPFLVIGSLFLSLATPAFAQSAGVSQIQSFITGVINVLVAVSTLIAVGYFVLGAIKYMTSGGNPEQMAEGKHAMATAAIGLVLVFAGYAIINVISTLAHSSFTQSL